MALTSFLGRLIRAAARLYPPRFQDSLAVLLKEADIDIPPKVYMGTMALVTLLSMAVSFALSSASSAPSTR